MFKLVAMLCSFSFAQKTKHLCSFLHCPTAKHELQLFRYKWWNLDYTRIDIQDAFSCGLNGAFLSIDKNRGWSPSLFSSVWIIKIHKCYKIDPTASPSLGCNIRRRIFNWNKLQWLMRRGCKNGIPVSVWFNWTSRWEPRGGHTERWQLRGLWWKIDWGYVETTIRWGSPPSWSGAPSIFVVSNGLSYYRNVTRGWYHGAIGTWDGGPESVVVAAKMSSIFIRAWQV